LKPYNLTARRSIVDRTAGPHKYLGMKNFVSLLSLILLSLTVSTAARATIPNFAQVRQGVYRGGQPTNTQDYVELRRHGVELVIDVRATGNLTADRRAAEAAGLRWVNLVVEGYPSEQNVNQALRYLAEGASRPVFIHCTFGADRTGLVVGLSRIQVEGWTPRQAHDEMDRMGFQGFVRLEQYFWDHAS
jgi:protein tyrosine phosphatase (PTP) superfamily phosphohydrolase (DUF442 family)